MKLTKQVLLLSWVKDKSQINPKRLVDLLTKEQLSEILLVLDKLRGLGGVFTIDEVVNDYLDDIGVDLAVPNKSDTGSPLDMTLLGNTHPRLDNGCIQVLLSHVLLGHGFRDTRANRRILTKHLKGLGYKVSKALSPTSAWQELSEAVELKEDYEPKFPAGLSVCEATPKKRNAFIVEWLYEQQVEQAGEIYKWHKINPRWEAYVVKRMHDLFEASELPYLYKHHTQRGCFDDVPEVRMIFQLAIRDVFKPMCLKEWVRLALSYELPLFESAENSHKEILVETCYDSVMGSLNKTTINGKPIPYDPQNVMGWLSILVISYIEDALNSYKGSRCHISSF